MDRPIALQLASCCSLLCTLTVLLRAGDAMAQQQTPPRPISLTGAQTVATPHLAEVAKRKQLMFNGVELSVMQQNTLLGNLGKLGCDPATMQIRQSTMAVPPALVSGESCRSLYAGTVGELAALRAAATQMVRKNKASDVAAFEQNIPANCPYKELYYYLAVLAALPGAQ